MFVSLYTIQNCDGIMPIETVHTKHHRLGQNFGTVGCLGALVATNRQPPVIID